jgi:hypothetical protein
MVCSRSGHISSSHLHLIAAINIAGTMRISIPSTSAQMLHRNRGSKMCECQSSCRRAHRPRSRSSKIIVCLRRLANRNWNRT